MNMQGMILLLYKHIRLSLFRKFVIRVLLRIEGYGYSPTVRAIYEKCHGITIGYGSCKTGCLRYDLIRPGTVFGRYCSIAPDVRIYNANHPLGDFTTHAITYNPKLGMMKRDELDRNTTVIGNDVWIGAGVIILPSVREIGNGAIIGAGSVVTKDVAPYSIVAGNPAKHIRNRFEHEVIKQLEMTKWWDFDKDDLRSKVNELREIVGYK